MKSCFAFACICLIQGLQAQLKSYDPENSSGQLFEYATYADARKKSYSPEEIISGDSLTFLPLNSDNQPVGFTSSYYWVRFGLTNSSKTSKTYYLETARPMTDLARLYQLTQTGTGRYESGDQIPFAKRQVAHRATVFKLELPPLSSTEYYLELPVQVTKTSKVPVLKAGNYGKEDEKSLLVVEDNPMNQLVMRKLLGKWPHLKFTVVANGKEALDFLKTNPCDLILMDLQMPVMDGYEATKIIREGKLSGVDRNIPIIAVTADSTEGTRKRVAEIGMNAYVSKPVDMELLYESIRQQLQHISLAG